MVEALAAAAWFLLRLSVSPALALCPPPANPCPRLLPPPTAPCPAPPRPAGEAEEEGYDDEYQLEAVEVAPADYIKPCAVANFRAAWDALPEDSEMVDDYGIGQRDSLQVR